MWHDFFGPFFSMGLRLRHLTVMVDMGVAIDRPQYHSIFHSLDL